MSDKTNPAALVTSKDTTLQAVFGMGGNEPIRVFTGRARVPKSLKSYKFTPKILKALTLWYKLGEDAGIANICLFGPHGSGKSEAIRQFAARLGIPVYEDIGSEDRVYADFVGMFLPTANGGTAFQESMLLQSMRDPGAIYLLNEIDKLSPKTSSDLHNLMDNRVIENPYNGDLIAAREGWRLAGTANSNGCGDSSGLYSGVKAMNRATVSRFRWLPVDYLCEEDEVEVVAQASDLNMDLVTKMVKFAAASRIMYTERTIRSIMTTREVVAWAKLTKAAKISAVLNNAQGCLEMTFMCSTSQNDRAALSKTFFNVFGVAYTGLPAN